MAQKQAYPPAAGQAAGLRGKAMPAKKYRAPTKGRY